MVYAPTLPPACFTASLIPLMIGCDAASSDPWSGSSIANLMFLPPAPGVQAEKASTEMAATAPSLVSFMHSPPRNQPHRLPGCGPRSGDPEPPDADQDPLPPPDAADSGPVVASGRPARSGRGRGARRQRLKNDPGRRAGG